MDRRGGTGKIIDFVHFDKQRKGHVVTQKLEHGMVEAILDVATRSGGKIIDAKNLVTLAEQSSTKMGAEKAGATRNQNPFLSQ
jgi:hypothetical protein